MRVAVVGSGISGLSAAWLLSRRHDVALFEKESWIGGHSNTVEVAEARGMCPVDTGFIVYNTDSYPNLVALFEHLNVPTAPASMSFAVSLNAGSYEYSGSGFSGYFGQRRNLLKVRHWMLAREILRFFKEAEAIGLADEDPEISLGDWLAARRYSADFIARHILPMGAAIWSTPAKEMLEFPAAAFARFFVNHGLLTINQRPSWRTVQGGSREYVTRLLADYGGRVVKNDAVTGIARDATGVTIEKRSGATERFDACVVACHADDALNLLTDADDAEHRLLSPFRYARNHAVLHTDATMLPQRKRLWSSWNYLSEGGDDRLSVTYWMNSLQPLQTQRDYFVTLNPHRKLAEGSEIAAFVYHHPMYDADAIKAQKELWGLQGRRRTWFAGSYFGYGFHEDGLQAGLAAAEDLGGISRPWRVANASGRIHVPGGYGQPASAVAAQ